MKNIFLPISLFVIAIFTLKSYAQSSEEIIEEVKNDQCLYLTNRPINDWSICINKQIELLNQVDWTIFNSLSQSGKENVSRSCEVFKARNTDRFVNCLNEQLVAYANLSSTDQESIENLNALQNQIDSPDETDENPQRMPESKILTAEAIFENYHDSVYMLLTGSSSKWTQGSAVAVSDSLLYTNCHVVLNENGSRKGDIFIINESTSAGQDSWFTAEIYRNSVTSDRCILETSRTNGLTPIPIRAVAELQIGESVLALGYPLAENVLSGLDSTVVPLTLSQGIISAIRRNNSGIHQIQTDAFIISGSSGGALLDMRGNLIGITTSGFKGTRINFALAAEEFSKL